MREVFRRKRGNSPDRTGTRPGILGEPGPELCCERAPCPCPLEALTPHLAADDALDASASPLWPDRRRQRKKVVQRAKDREKLVGPSLRWLLEPVWVVTVCGSLQSVCSRSEFGIFWKTRVGLQANCAPGSAEIRGKELGGRRRAPLAMYQAVSLLCGGWPVRGPGNAKYLKSMVSGKVRFALPQVKTLEIVPASASVHLNPHTVSNKIEWYGGRFDCSEGESKAEQMALQHASEDDALLSKRRLL